MPPGLDGSGQTIGIIAFADFDDDDIRHFLKYNNLSISLINNVEKDYIDGGPNLTSAQALTEGVLDVDSVLSIAPGAQVVVYGGPGTGNASGIFALLSLAIDNIGLGGTLTSSYGICETNIGQSDAASVDSLLETAAASGITLFVATGDAGNVCADGNSGILYPADAPHAVAVGGTSLYIHSNGSYSHERWWNNLSGAGGFGSSIYTNALEHPALSRSVPDVAMDADPGTAMVICEQALYGSSNNPGCLEGAGGTSMASPMWAAFWSMVNQARVDGGLLPFSAGNGYLTTVPDIFHSPSTMTGPGNDSAHLGMGTPKVVDLVSVAGPKVEIASVSPDFGTALGSTPVTITGQGFIGVKKVTFGGVEATNVLIFSDSRMVVQTPAASKAEVDIRVETPAGTSDETSSDKFHYVPVLTSVKPDHGPLAGEAIVTVAGTGLSAYHGFQYMFGGIPATKVSCSSSTSCTMTIPEHALGKVSLTIDTPFGNSPNSLNFTYGAPEISSFSPAVGPTSGGLYVAIHGSNLATGMTVRFGSTAVTKVICSDEFFCWLDNPEVSGPESVSLTATVDGVTSAPTTALFMFEVFPTIMGISPEPANGGATVTLSGTGFSTSPGQTIFNFFNNVQCQSSTQCTAVVPPALAGSPQCTAISVTVNGNTSLDSVEFCYANKVPPPPCTGTTCG